MLTSEEGLNKGKDGRYEAGLKTAILYAPSPPTNKLALVTRSPNRLRR
jgi:hypothetical protein